MTKERAVLVAYALSHVVGAVLILVGIALLGDSGRKTASDYLTYMYTSPLFIALMIISIILIIAILYFDFKLKKEDILQKYWRYPVPHGFETTTDEKKAEGLFPRYKEHIPLYGRKQGYVHR